MNFFFNVWAEKGYLGTLGLKELTVAVDPDSKKLKAQKLSGNFKRDQKIVIKKAHWDLKGLTGI